MIAVWAGQVPSSGRGSPDPDHQDWRDSLFSKLACGRAFEPKDADSEAGCVGTGHNLDARAMMDLAF